MQYILPLVALGAAVKASPLAFPQAVTAIVTPQGTAPPGCMPTFSGSFGIAVMNISTSTAAAKRQVSQITDGQPQAYTMAPVSQITDGQVQGGTHTMVMTPVSEFTDGQPQAPKQTMAPVSEFSDGQPQAPKTTSTPVSSTTTTTSTPVPSTTVAPVSQITDGQPQGVTSTPRITTTVIATSTTIATSTVIATLTKSNSTRISTVSTMSTSTVSKASNTTISTTSTSSTAATPTSTGNHLVACQSNGTLALTLSNGILKDSHGRTGYIASNFQFQFDNPPQAGAIYTAGFSVCSNGSLALGGSNVFYQCLSGNFYNLYNENWAPQCSPVTINVLSLINCTTSG